MDDSSINDWDFIFRKELKKAFDLTKDLILNKMSESEQVPILTKIANDFYDTLVKSPIPVDKPNPNLDASVLYISSSINLPYSCFMVPYFFYEALQANISFDLEPEFSQNLPWNELIGIINQKWRMERKKLTKTDVLICKVLSRYNSKNQSFKFPITLSIVANRTRQSMSSIEKTFFTLFTRIIVSDFFLINPWKLGWELYLVSYKFIDDNRYTDFDSMTISKEFLLNDEVFRIIQIPFLKTNDDLKIIKQTVQKTDGKIHLITETSYHWELSQLQPREDKSFINPPDLNLNYINSIEPSVSFTYEKDSLKWLENFKN